MLTARERDKRTEQAFLECSVINTTRETRCVLLDLISSSLPHIQSVTKSYQYTRYYEVLLQISPLIPLYSHLPCCFKMFPGFVSSGMVRDTDMERTATKEEAYTHRHQETGGDIPHHIGLPGEAPGSVRRWKE